MKSLLTVTVVLEFLMGLHTFSFWIELLIVPFSLFLVALTTFAKQKPEYHSVQLVLKWVGIALGIAMVLAEFSYVINHFNEFARVAYLKQFFLPIELSIMFIPFLYGLVTYMHF